MKDLFIKPILEGECVEVSFTGPENFTQCQWKVLENGKVKSHGHELLLPNNINSFIIPIPNFQEWTVDNPFLYQLELDLKGEQETQKIQQNFGMVNVKAEGKWIYVNGHKFYPRAYIRGREAHEHPNLMNLPPEDFYAKNIRAAKEYGFNMIRFHSRIPEEACLKVADELGIFVHVELRKYFGKYQKQRQQMSDEGEIIDRQSWIDTVMRLRSHPCVFSYCMGNEIRHPGTNPYVEEIAQLTKKLDPNRLFIDTCAHGEFDREYVDFDVQHMSYYYPFGKNYDMFDNTYNWTIYGSCKGNTLEKQSENFKLTRGLHIDRPVLAHEICHYISMHDLDALEKKFNKYCPEQKPWWIDELKKLIKLKGHQADYNKMIQASRRFQFLSWKLGIEAARRSKLLAGFHFLQLADTERYENANGLLDCFDDKKGFDEQEFLKFNGKTVILADLPQRVFFENKQISLPVYISHFDSVLSKQANFEFELVNAKGETILSSSLENLDIQRTGLYELCRIDLQMPNLKKPEALTLKIKLKTTHPKTIENNWTLWVFPNRPEELGEIQCNNMLSKYNFSTRYNLQHNSAADLVLADHFTDDVFEQLNDGRDVLMLYRIDETRARINPNAEKEKYYLPTSWDRFKGTIWDRGTNCGAFIRDNKPLQFFPNDGFMDLQFHDLVDDCDKICLDDFPVDIEPAIQAVDKAVRDRFDVYTYSLSDLQPAWTMRKFAYLFELNVGKGRLVVCGFNFSKIKNDNPAQCGMFESLIKYMRSDTFKPETSIEAQGLKKYLQNKAAQPRLKERKMTQFWQLNSMPLESDAYWNEAEKWIEQ